MYIERFLVELRGEPVGVAVHEGKGCRFYAASFVVMELNKRFFPSAGAVEDACRKLVAAKAVQKSTH